jgi:hypothetical protein
MSPQRSHAGRHAHHGRGGFADLNLSAWVGLFAPARTPQPVIDQLNRAVRKVLQGEIKAKLGENGMEVAPGTPEQLKQTVPRTSCCMPSWSRPLAWCRSERCPQRQGWIRCDQQKPATTADNGGTLEAAPDLRHSPSATLIRTTRNDRRHRIAPGLMIQALPPPEAGGLQAHRL